MSARCFGVTALIVLLLGGGNHFGSRTLAAGDPAAEVRQAVRAALGGEEVLGAIQTLAFEGPFTRAMGERQIDGTLTLTLALPDRLHRREETEMPGGGSLERISALAGDVAWEDIESHGGMGGRQMMAFRGPGGRQVDEQTLAGIRSRRMKAELQRWMLALFVQTDPLPAYAGVAESRDGKADVLEVKDERGQPLRLFVDQTSHLPLMLSYQEVRPRMAMNRSGGRRRGGPPPEAGADGSNEPRPEAQGPPKPSAVTIYFSDYRASSGVMLPHKMTQSLDGRPFESWTIDEVKVNPKVDPSLFEKKGQ